MQDLKTQRITGSKSWRETYKQQKSAPVVWCCLLQELRLWAGRVPITRDVIDTQHLYTNVSWVAEMAAHYGTAVLLTSALTARQSQGRGRGSHHRAMDFGAAAPSPVLRSGRVERGDQLAVPPRATKSGR